MSINLFGGAEVQAIALMNAVNNLRKGFIAKAFNMWEDKLDQFDIVHIFGPGAFPSESLAIARFARDNKIAVVVSPIFYLNSKELLTARRNVFANLTWAWYLRVRNVISNIRLLRNLDIYHNVSQVLASASLVIPNTRDEFEFLSSFFHLEKSRCKVIPNGVDAKFRAGDPALFKASFGVDDFILFVGRIEPRKNVLRLIGAFERSGLNSHLVILGQVADIEYYSKCKKEATNKVLFVPPMAHDSALLASAYKASKVVALPSYHETPGLAALEGGLAGANVVITSVGGTRDYFRDYAWYVDPTSEDSICRALISAFSAPKTNQLSDYLERSFGWSAIAENMVGCYQSVVSGDCRS